MNMMTETRLVAVSENNLMENLSDLKMFYLSDWLNFLNHFTNSFMYFPQSTHVIISFLIIYL